MTKETSEEIAAKERYGNYYCDEFEIIEASRNGFVEGARWKEESIVDNLEKKWLEYRQYTNNTDAWSFKDWLIQQYKNKL